MCAQNAGRDPAKWWRSGLIDTDVGVMPLQLREKVDSLHHAFARRALAGDAHRGQLLTLWAASLPAMEAQTPYEALIQMVFSSVY